MKIQDFVAGDRVRLLDFGQTPKAYKRQLIAYGFNRGVEVELIRFAPLGCPVQLNVRGASIAIRLNDAHLLQWERV